jgi:DNA-directed RNA polymerase subunit RPC12/RpoP
VFTPHIMCASCQHIFASEATLDDVVTCPNCSHEGKPERIMKATGFPSLETFTKNWQRSKKVIEVDEEQ